MRLFDGIRYCLTTHKAHLPCGRVLSARQFNVHFSGHMFVIDGRKTNKAWAAMLRELPKDAYFW